MELHQLRCFLAVAELLNFSRAAEQIHLSQPALSIQIRALERELGVKLFERTHHKTTLTDAGRIYREEARHMLEEAVQAVSNAQLAAAGKIGKLRIGFISTAAAHIVPSLVSEFRKSHPQVELELRHALTAEQIELLESRTLDIGFFRVPIIAQGEIRTIPVHREPFKVFLPSFHPLAHSRQLRLRQLNGAEFVVYARKNAPGFHDLLINLLKDAGAVPASIYEANDMYTLVSLVAAGVGIAIAPASVENYRLPGVVVRDAGRMPLSEVALGYRTGLKLPAAQAFIDLTLAAHQV